MKHLRLFVAGLALLVGCSGLDSEQYDEMDGGDETGQAEQGLFRRAPYGVALHTLGQRCPSDGTTCVYPAEKAVTIGIDTSTVTDSTDLTSLQNRLNSIVASTNTAIAGTGFTVQIKNTLPRDITIRQSNVLPPGQGSCTTPLSHQPASLGAAMAESPAIPGVHKVATHTYVDFLKPCLDIYVLECGSFQCVDSQARRSEFFAWFSGRSVAAGLGLGGHSTTANGGANHITFAVPGRDGVLASGISPGEYCLLQTYDPSNPSVITSDFTSCF